MTPILAILAASFVWADAPRASKPAPPASEPARGWQPPSVTIDPGHGGQDLGAVVRGRTEKELVLAVSRRLREKLSPWRARLTRDGDFYVPLDERIGISRASGASAFISIHADQTRSRKARGVKIYAYGTSRIRIPPRRFRWPLPALPAPPAATAKEGAELARAVARSLRSDGIRADAEARAKFYVLKNPEVPSILIELGYLTNPAEAKLLEDPAYQDRLAEGIARGLRAFLSPSGFGPERALARREAVSPSK